MTLDEAKQFLHVDWDDEDTYIQSLIDTVQVYIDKNCGTEYRADEDLMKLSDLVQKKILNDLYDNKSSYIPENVKRDNIVISIFHILANAQIDLDDAATTTEGV